MATTEIQSLESVSASPAPTATSNVLTFKSHPGLLQVIHGEGSFSSKLVVLRDFAVGDVITKIEGYTLVTAPRYTTVQVGVNTHVELNSDLVFMNVSNLHYLPFFFCFLLLSFLF